MRILETIGTFFLLCLAFLIVLMMIFGFFGFLADLADASTQSGQASYYCKGQKTASGQRFNPNALTAAHRSYPFGSRVKVTNRRNGKSVVVVINDRGPFVKGRIIDLSCGAAKQIGMMSSGVAPVTVTKQ